MTPGKLSTGAPTWDTSGNLGFGVTPSSWDSTYKALQVGSRSMFYGIGSEANMANNAYYNAGYKYVASSAAGLYTIDANVHKWYNAASGTAGNAISFTQAMTLDANGKLLVGGTTSDLSSTSQAMIMGSGGLAVQYTGTTGTLLQVVPGAANGTVDFKADARSGNYPAMTFYTFATERARITSSGELLVGTTSASITSGLGTKIGNDSAGAFVSTVTSSTTNGASFAYTYYSTGAGAYRFYVGAGGTVFATSTTISSLSDARYKENIRDLDAGLSEIMALQPRKFDWKEGKGANIKNARGFIAQEFEQVFPDMIDEWRDEAPEGEAPYKSVRADLIPVLVKAIQEQQAIIETLTSRIEALEQA